MSEISLQTVAGKLNSVGYTAFMQSLNHAKKAGNRNVELVHWIFHILSNDRSDMTITLNHYGIDRGRVLTNVAEIINNFRVNVTEMPSISENMIECLDRSWHFATLLFGEVQIRTGHVLVAMLKNKDLTQALRQISKELAELDANDLVSNAAAIWRESDEESLRPMDGSGLAASSGSDAEGSDGKEKAATALGRYSIDMTEAASSGKMDPVVGRDEEIRQIVDVLMRRRQNNPMLTGEAGVGKTAVVEGFAQRLASGDVPPALQGVRLHSLDIGLMQAGASMKGEFEQRLRAVIDEVQSSPTPIILFIDEAHTLIGAGGQAGTGDAANLLKPALARGTLRTIGATTWSEYRQHIEKDPALTRRFQPVNIDEPSVDRCTYMLRGILAPMEKHHNVRISDEAVKAAVTLSARYIPSRQLPDKAVSLLDTACARVAISQSTLPAAIADQKENIAKAEKELGAQERETDLGTADLGRIEELKVYIAEAEEKLSELEAAYAREMTLVEQILSVRKALDGKDDGDAFGQDNADADGSGESNEESQLLSKDELRKELSSKIAVLDGFDPDSRMVYPHVGEQTIAAIVSDWTGIPVGRMVKDEIQTILDLSGILKKRVLGQDHGLAMIAKRIETNRAKLDNPNKPIGVFMLCGPSGVGKTESALALAESLYGGEQNIITINMSEFQEAHSVSLLKGAPPGYVGYGEGGRLTEAVRRNPYSVVLLDEVEKAHPDVHELFFQVFDKGIMEDGNGRKIDFKNTIIILTSNVGTEVIMEMADQGNLHPDPDALNEALKPELVKVFPPALLGRIVTIPYFPLSSDVLGGIVKLQMDRIVKRIKDNHNARMSYSEDCVNFIVSQCKDPDSGGRMIDNIITNSLLPEMSRRILNITLDKGEFSNVELGMLDGKFTYVIE
nr:type VI secretion system ATPase TssH [uncultured Cohaesibacter sp.]